MLALKLIQMHLCCPLTREEITKRNSLPPIPFLLYFKSKTFLLPWALKCQCMIKHRVFLISDLIHCSCSFGCTKWKINIVFFMQVITILRIESMWFYGQMFVNAKNMIRNQSNKMNPNRWVASNPSSKPSNVNIKRGIYLFQYILMRRTDTKKNRFLE